MIKFSAVNEKNLSPQIKIMEPSINLELQKQLDFYQRANGYLEAKVSLLHNELESAKERISDYKKNSQRNFSIQEGLSLLDLSSKLDQKLLVYEKLLTEALRYAKLCEEYEANLKWCRQEILNMIEEKKRLEYENRKLRETVNKLEEAVYYLQKIKEVKNQECIDRKSVG